jgi:hypothetical protein
MLAWTEINSLGARFQVEQTLRRKGHELVLGVGLRAYVLAQEQAKKLSLMPNTQREIATTAVEQALQLHKTEWLA